MTLRDQLQTTLGTAFTLERELAGGAMSRVFVATETRLHRSVVVKVMSPEVAADISAERFEREIRVAASLQQANIVPVLSAGDMNGVPYYTMPFVEGESLRARLAVRGALSIHEAIGVLRDVARALSYAHAHGVVHRDIKPDNVLLSHGTAVVTDFGIAKAISAARTDAGFATLTQTGTSIGTPAYMAPEQVAGDPAIDHRADIYSFGCMAYELFAGRPPFVAPTPQRLLAAHLMETAAPLRELRPETPPAVASLVMRCLSKAAADRPSNANEITEALDAVATPSAVETPPARQRLTPWLWRVGIMIAAVIVGAMGLVVYGRRAAPVDRSIVVLPLTNLSGDPANDYLGEGLAEEITNVLGKAGLVVKGRSTARTLVGKDPQEIGKQLGVASVLQGGVQRDGDQLRITISLLSTSDGRDVWSERYDKPRKDWFAVQDEIARRVADKLRVALTGGAGSASLGRTETTDPEAHALYLQGLYLWNRRTGQKLQQAIRLFEEATRRDSSYARAYAGIALADVVLPNYADVPYDEWTSKAVAAAQRALSIDSTIAEAHAAIAYASALNFDNAAAEREFAQALRLDSTLAIAHGWHAILLGRNGRFDDAHREAEAAWRLEPQSLIVQTVLGGQLLNARRYAAADSVLGHIYDIDSTFGMGLYFRAIAFVEQSRYSEAITLLERLVRDPNLRTSAKLGALAYAYARAGQTAAARTALARLPRDTALSSTCAVAAALSALGQPDEAAVVLRRAVSLHDLFLTVESHSGMFDGLRRDPRLAPLFAKIEAP